MQERAWASSPSPTRKWSSGFERILLVSIMGGIWPAPTAALYAAWVGYRGGGGSTLSAVISDTSVILYCSREGGGRNDKRRGNKMGRKLTTWRRWDE